MYTEKFRITKTKAKTTKQTQTDKTKKALKQTKNHLALKPCQDVPLL